MRYACCKYIIYSKHNCYYYSYSIIIYLLARYNKNDNTYAINCVNINEYSYIRQI